MADDSTKFPTKLSTKFLRKVHGIGLIGSCQPLTQYRQCECGLHPQMQTGLFKQARMA